MTSPIVLAQRKNTFLHTNAFLHIQLFRERLSGKVHATILKGIVGCFEFSVFQRNLKELSRKAMDVCLRVLKEYNKSRFDSYSRQEQCIDHIPYHFSGLSRAHFSDNLSRNSCIIQWIVVSIHFEEHNRHNRLA